MAFDHGRDIRSLEFVVLPIAVSESTITLRQKRGDRQDNAGLADLDADVE